MSYVKNHLNGGMNMSYVKNHISGGMNNCEGEQQR